ncbi:hypothetical protein HELRODRAFT_165370 [Helobdella robusta]|uniref:ISXO2-like transposase domain-containing protein n=1 Tax=Helobdella robusta TaxID=6412 RepID=T1EWN5_HELRO|nr:hypothetical protein HELRODRAFT_165370 [Helobdella robusta]ESN91346.1 hypothetical protein HELRODRAFT_165370 [Helobdella robusta]
MVDLKTRIANTEDAVRWVKEHGLHAVTRKCHCLADRRLQNAQQHPVAACGDAKMVTTASLKLRARWVLGGIDMQTKNPFLVEVERRDAATLFPLIQRHVLPGITAWSDQWAAYNCITPVTGLNHQTVNHSIILRTVNGVLTIELRICDDAPNKNLKG